MPAHAVDPRRSSGRPAVSDRSSPRDALFVAKVVHELRQPLQAVMAALAVLGTSPLSSRQAQASAAAQRECRRARRRLDHLLDSLRASRLATGGVQAARLERPTASEGRRPAQTARAGRSHT